MAQKYAQEVKDEVSSSQEAGSGSMTKICIGLDCELGRMAQ